MLKQLKINLEGHQYWALKKEKKGRTWKELLLSLIKEDQEEDRVNN